VNGTVANSGTLSIGRVGVLNVNNGASWTQSGDMSLSGIGGYSATMNVQAGASFASTGTNPILLNGAASNSGRGLLNISGTGTMTTATGFEQTTTPTTGYGRVTLSGGGTLKLSANVSTLTNQVQFALGAGGGVIDTNGHDATLSGAVTVGSGAALATGISGAGGLTKQGGGILTLSGTNTYTGATLVSAGTLLITGALSNSDVTVDASATVGGTGTLGGDLAMNGSSLFTVSDLIDPLSVTGTITFGSGFGIGNLLGLDWDALDLNSPYTLISTTQTFSSSDIANFGSANAVTVGTGRSAYFQNGSLQVVVIPEPRAALLGGLAVLLLLRRRRP
jgi:autotransporter-associated beta strand protein